MARQNRLHNELVLVDQSQIRQGQGEGHATHQQALAWLLLEPLNRLPQVALHQFGIPIDPAQRARHDVLLRPVNGLGERDLPLTHPVRPRARHRLPPRRLHHLVGHPAEQQGIGSSQLCGPVAHRLLVRGEPCLVMAAAVESDVDRVSKWSHRDVPLDAAAPAGPYLGRPPRPLLIGGGSLCAVRASAPGPTVSATESALGASPPRTAGVSCNEPIVVVRALPGSTARPNNTAGTFGSEGLPAVPGRAMAGEVRGESEKKRQPRSPRSPAVRHAQLSP